MTLSKLDFIEIMREIESLNTQIAHKQGYKCESLFKQLDRRLIMIAKRLGIELTGDDLEDIHHI